METIVFERMFQHSVHELRNANMFQFISFYEVLGEFLIKKWYLKWSKQWIKKNQQQQQHHFSFHYIFHFGEWFWWRCGVVNLMIAGRIDIVLSERKSTGAP